MTTFDQAQAKLDEGTCLNCFTPYQLSLIQTQLLFDIMNGGGGGGGSTCLLCSDADPVAAPSCDCALHVNRLTGALFYWDSSLSVWVKLIGG